MLIWVLGTIAILLFCNLCMFVSIYNRLTKVEETTNHTNTMVQYVRNDQLKNKGVYSSRIGEN